MSVEAAIVLGVWITVAGMWNGEQVTPLAALIGTIVATAVSYVLV